MALRHKIIKVTASDLIAVKISLAFTGDNVKTMKGLELPPQWGVFIFCRGEVVRREAVS